jgi:sarcosine oxidase
VRNNFDIIVIGVGAMGAATCFQLAARGVRVLGIEQFDIPHDRGSSHGESRMIRSSYYEEPRYVPLLQRAYQLWDELEALSGKKILYRVGGLYMGPPSGMLIKGAALSAAAHQLAHEKLSREDLRKRYPQFVVPADWGAIFETEAGFLLPEEIIRTYAELAQVRGAEIHTREMVRSWRADAHTVTVITDRDEYKADRLIFTGGAWTAKLIGDLGISLEVTRQVLGWVSPPKPELLQLGHFPAWAIDSLDGGVYYGFPMMPTARGLKLAHHHPSGNVFDPDNPSREPRADDENDFRPCLKKYMPCANGPLVQMRICMYTNSPDHNFIVDRHPQHENVHIACGFSGHGFKFASVIGEILANLAMEGATKLPIDFLSLNRFS